MPQAFLATRSATLTAILAKSCAIAQQVRAMSEQISLAPLAQQSILKRFGFYPLLLFFFAHYPIVLWPMPYHLILGFALGE